MIGSSSRPWRVNAHQLATAERGSGDDAEQRAPTADSRQRQGERPAPSESDGCSDTSAPGAQSGRTQVRPSEICSIICACCLDAGGVEAESGVATMSESS